MKSLRQDVAKVLGEEHAHRVEWGALYYGEVVEWSVDGLAKRRQLALAWLERAGVQAESSGVRLDTCPHCLHLSLVWCTCGHGGGSGGGSGGGGSLQCV